MLSSNFCKRSNDFIAILLITISKNFSSFNFRIFSSNYTHEVLFWLLLFNNFIVKLCNFEEDVMTGLILIDLFIPKAKLNSKLSNYLTLNNLFKKSEGIV